MVISVNASITHEPVCTQVNKAVWKNENLTISMNKTDLIGKSIASRRIFRLLLFFIQKGTHFISRIKLRFLIKFK